MYPTLLIASRSRPDDPAWRPIGGRLPVELAVDMLRPISQPLVVASEGASGDWAGLASVTIPGPRRDSWDLIAALDAWPFSRDGWITVVSARCPFLRASTIERARRLAMDNHRPVVSVVRPRHHPILYQWTLRRRETIEAKPGESIFELPGDLDEGAAFWFERTDVTSGDAVVSPVWQVSPEGLRPLGGAGDGWRVEGCAEVRIIPPEGARGRVRLVLGRVEWSDHPAKTPVVFQDLWSVDFFGRGGPVDAASGVPIRGRQQFPVVHEVAETLWIIRPSDAPLLLRSVARGGALALELEIEEGGAIENTLDWLQACTRVMGLQGRGV